MGMTTKSGRYFSNPRIGEAHERAEAEEKRGTGRKPEPPKPEGGDDEPKPRGGAHSVHIFVDEAGSHHVAAHHPHGVEHSEHGSLDEAMDHARGEMEGGGPEHGDEGEGQEGDAPGLMSTLAGGSY